MGGHLAGEVASQLAIDAVGATIETTPAPDEAGLVDALERSNAAIRGEARDHPELDGMGTTCTVVAIGDVVRIAHVGDSRAYRFRDGRLEQLTQDHSLVASLVREGVIDAARARTDARRNIVTRALGAEDEVRVDRVETDRAAGDRLLLCTDGLHGQVDDAAIAAVLAAAATPADAADRLVGLANRAGGDDNVTVIVIDVDRLDAGRGRGCRHVGGSDAVERGTPSRAAPAPDGDPRGRRRTAGDRHRRRRAGRRRDPLTSGRLCLVRPRLEHRAGACPRTPRWQRPGRA